MFHLSRLKRIFIIIIYWDISYTLTMARRQFLPVVIGART
jgi:hypothetical protein